VTAPVDDGKAASDDGNLKAASEETEEQDLDEKSLIPGDLTSESEVSEVSETSSSHKKQKTLRPLDFKDYYDVSDGSFGVWCDEQYGAACDRHGWDDHQRVTSIWGYLQPAARSKLNRCGGRLEKLPWEKFIPAAVAVMHGENYPTRCMTGLMNLRQDTKKETLTVSEFHKRFMNFRKGAGSECALDEKKLANLFRIGLRPSIGKILLAMGAQTVDEARNQAEKIEEIEWETNPPPVRKRHWRSEASR
jgi:hypothetical protein